MQSFGDYEPDEIDSALKQRDYKDATDLVAYNITFCDSNGLRQDRPNGGLYVNETDKANTLSAGDPGERTVIAIDLQQVTSAINRSVPHEVTPPLTPQSETVVWEKQQVGIHAGTGQDLSPALTEIHSAIEDGNGRQAFVVQQLGVHSGNGIDVSPALTSEGADSSEDGRGRHAFVVEALDARNSESNGDLSGTLQAKKTGGYSLNYINPIAIGLSGELNASEEKVNALDAGSKSGGGQPAMALTHFGVRRLTPVETERLQNFPDNWTKWRADGSEQSDTMRYKQCGNAVTVSVVEWVIKRIVETLNDHDAAGENHG